MTKHNPPQEEEKPFKKKEFESWFNLAVSLGKNTYNITIADEKRKFEALYREGLTVDDAINKFLYP